MLTLTSTLNFLDSYDTNIYINLTVYLGSRSRRRFTYSHYILNKQTDRHTYYLNSLLFGVNHLLDPIHSIKSVDKLSKVIDYYWRPVTFNEITIYNLFTNCQKSDDWLISNQYYPSIIEKINTIEQLLVYLKRLTSFTYRKTTETDKQTDDNVVSYI